MNHEPGGNSKRISAGWQAFGCCCVIAFAVTAWYLTTRSSRPRDNQLLSPSTATRPAEPTVTAVSSYEPPDSLGFVGSQACSECHAEICEQYARHPMALSVRPVDAATEPGNQARELTRFAGNQRVYEVECRDGQMLHHELMFDEHGQPIYDHEVQIDYVVGSGRRARAYLHRRGELLFMSSLNWYSAEGVWDLAPAYLPDDPRRFERRVQFDCAGCHVGRANPIGRETNRFATPSFHETAIGCERCHGPAKEHIDFQTGSRESGSSVDPIVNPRQLDHDRREAVCYQCHLQAAARVLRPGRSHLDFRPGQRLDDIWIMLDAGTQVDASGHSRSINHVQQMRDSRCFIASDHELGCISCHDPHRIPAPAERVGFYRQQCLKCHGGEDCREESDLRLAHNDSCIDCHMPKSRTSNIAHVSQTDHRILRKYLSDQPAPEVDLVGSLTIFQEPSDLSESERARALGIGAYQYLTSKGKPTPGSIIQLLRGLVGQFPADGSLLTALGAMAENAGRFEQAREMYTRALPLESAEESARRGLLNVEYLQQNWTEALGHAERLLSWDPRNARVLIMRGMILDQLGRTDEAIESVRLGLDYNPTILESQQWLARKLSAAGREAEARRRTELWERLKSARPPDPPR